MNYYEILEVSVNASKEVIKNAYRALTKKYHPDSYAGDKEYAQNKMREINNAYETLIDDNKRLLYDYDNGFKIDPNAPVENVDNDIEINNEYKGEENTNSSKSSNKNNKKMVIIIAVIIIVVLFILAFLIGSSIAEDGTENEYEEDKNYTEFNKDDNENIVNHNTYVNNSNIDNTINNEPKNENTTNDVSVKIDKVEDTEQDTQQNIQQDNENNFIDGES